MSHAAQPYRPRPCPECGGQRVLVNLNITTPIGEESRELELKQPKRVLGLGELFHGKSNTSDIAAVSCTNCGYTALYAIQPNNLIPDQD